MLKLHHLSPSCFSLSPDSSFAACKICSGLELQHSFAFKSLRILMEAFVTMATPCELSEPLLELHGTCVHVSSCGNNVHGRLSKVNCLKHLCSLGDPFANHQDLAEDLLKPFPAAIQLFLRLYALLKERAGVAQGHLGSSHPQTAIVLDCTMHHKMKVSLIYYWQTLSQVPESHLVQRNM